MTKPKWTARFRLYQIAWCFILFLLYSVPIYSQSEVIEGLSFESSILGEEVNYAIYLPEGYYTSQRSYPTLYLLHGYGNDESAWIQYGNMQSMMDECIENGSLTQMIVVMPDADNSWYSDDITGGYRYESMLIEEFIGFIDTEFRTRKSKKFRAIGGLSMGAYGALMLSFRNSSEFSGAFALSPAIWADGEIQKLSDADYTRTFGKIYTTDSSDRLTSHWNDYSVLHLASTKKSDELSKVEYYVNTGDDDKGISVATAELHMILKEREISHEYRVYNGGHTWIFWRKTFPEAVKFISDIFLTGVD